MKADILKHIAGMRSTLPKNQQLVANYLVDNWETALYESSMMIAKKVGVSQSTVVRTVTSLGYKGFLKFQAELRSLLKDQFSSIKRINQVSVEQEGQSIKQKIDLVFQQHQKNLKMTLRYLKPEQLIKAAEKIWSGKKVCILGLRTSGVSANYLGVHLSMIRGNVTILSSDYGLWETTRTLNKDDVLIVFSFMRYCRNTIVAASLAHERGCTVIGITDTMSAPLTQISDIIFHVPVISMHYSNSYVAVFALIDVLLNTIGTTNREATMKALQSMEEGFEKFQVFIDA